MSGVVIYTSALCGFCSHAKRLLKQKGAEITEIDVTFSPKKRAEMMQKTGRTSVPQIWIGDHHVGGADELLALEEAGRLDDLLAAAA